MAVGDDCISPRVLRAAIEPLSIIITRIINLSISTGTCPTVVNEFKYLGLVLDQNLCFDKHIDFIVDKTTMKLGVLYKTRWLFDLSTAKMLYCALIVPTLIWVTPSIQWLLNINLKGSR